MDYAKDRSGKKARTWELTLQQAKGQEFVCFHCDVPMDVAKMPALGARARSGPRSASSHVEFYFRTRKGFQHGVCPFSADVVAAVIEKRVVRTRSGRSGAPPAVIRFGRELVRAASGSAEEAVTANLPRRHRYQPSEEELLQRGPRQTVISSIERACVAYLDRSVPLSSSLKVDKIAGELDTYAKVFGRLEDTQLAGSRIWHANLSFRNPPRLNGAVLLLRTFAGAIAVDRCGWRPSAVQDFDAELGIMLDFVRDAWKPGGGAPAPVIFILGERLTGDILVEVSDARKVCVLIRDPA